MRTALFVMVITAWSIYTVSYMWLEARGMPNVYAARLESLERVRAVGRAIVGCAVCVVMSAVMVVCGIVLYFVDKGYWAYVFFAAMCMIVLLVHIRNLVQLMKDDDSWFNGRWKKIKRWMRAHKPSLRHASRPKLA